MKAGALRAQLAAEIEKLRAIEWNVHEFFPNRASSGIELMHDVEEAEEILRRVRELVCEIGRAEQ